MAKSSSKILTTVLAILSIFQTADAQTIVLDPIATTVADADDYFTDVTADPRTFDSTCDIGSDNFVYNPENVINGLWTGINPAKVGPIFGAIAIPQVGTPLVFKEDCDKLGLHFPVNADKYTRLSYNVNMSDTNTIGIAWSKDRNFAIRGIDPQFDRYTLPGINITTPANRFNIKTFDLPNEAPADFPWSGTVTGLSLQPNNQLPLGGVTHLKWIRLIDPTTSPTVRLNWNAAGVGPDTRVHLFVDSDDTGFDGDAVRRVLPTTHTLDFPTGELAPGTYYFYVEVEEPGGGGAVFITRSGYAGPVVVNGKPTLSFRSPTRMTGQEYSRDERGDAWDMNEATDLVNFNLQAGANQALQRGFHDPQVANGIFTAESDFDPQGASISVDTQVLFTVPTVKPINTNLYRYFCYRMQLDTTNIDRATNITELDQDGFVSRLIYNNTGTGAFGSTGAHEVTERSVTFLDGLTTYCFDLWDDSIFESGQTWRQVNRTNLIRLDPIEARDPTKFAIDFAGLYSENRTKDGLFEIEFNANDPEGDPLLISFHIDSNQSGFGGSEIHRVTNYAGGAGSFVWDANSIPDGTYYIFAIVTDGLNTSKFYTDVAIHVGAAGPTTTTVSRRTPCDYDGDGDTDFTVVRPTFTANWFLDAAPDFAWGFASFDLFFDADVDGDRRSDITVARKQSPMGWHSIVSSNFQAASIFWGLLGDIPLAPDIDGDNISDRTVFRPAEGNWYVLLSSGGARVQQWGLPGDVPVWEDYDGDGLDDFAIWRPAFGLWAIILSSKNYSTDPNDIILKQWGLFGDLPMPGDYTGDGKADLVVWRNSDANWYICPSDGGFDCSQLRIVQFGLPGDVPVKGDWDGDGTLDVGIWRTANGTWFYRRSSDGVIATMQWGLAGDLPLCLSPLRYAESATK